MNYYISDMHIAHKNILSYDSRPFEDTDAMAEEMTLRWNGAVTDEDCVYVLGDFAWKDHKGLKMLSKLRGRKFLVLGNHDHPSNETLKHFEWVKELALIKDGSTEVVLCHYPIAHWDGQYRGAVHLYGHVHRTKDYTAFLRYADICRELGIPFECYNVGCMMPYMDYTPRTLEEIRKGASL